FVLFLFLMTRPSSCSTLFPYTTLFRSPVFGKLFAKSYKEYSWLQESAKTFPGMKQLAKLFTEVGFEKVKYKPYTGGAAALHLGIDRKSTRLNSSHVKISYAVFCLKKKK